MPLAQDMACKEFVELVTDYLEGALPPALRAAFEEHLQVCSDCSMYLGQMRLTVRALHALDGGSLSAPTRQALLQQFREWRDRDAGSSDS